MGYTEQLKIQKELKKFDRKINKLYKEYKTKEIEQNKAEYEDVHDAYIVILESINAKIMILSEERETFQDLFDA
jgi:hypothetical protein